MAVSVEEQSQFLPNEAVNIVIPEKLLQIVTGRPRENHDLGCPMQKVPPLLRLDKNNQQDYDPLVVCLGPYHHGKEELQSAEEFKLIALEMFVADSGHDVLFFYFKVLQLVNDARNCYFEDSTKKYDDEKFAQMMLLDACFIINDIISRCKSGANFYITRYCLGDLASAIVLRDMFLLENQIPFWLLKFLMCLRCGKQEGEEMLNEFLNGTMFGNYKGSGIASRDKDLSHHLLDAFWLVLVSESSIFTSIFAICHVFCSGEDQILTMILAKKKYVHCFRSATELKAKGIHFRRSSADSLKGIKFKSSYFYATLEVPIWFVSIYTKVFFLNMIAYEMCPSISTDRAVTAYIEFMKSLIDSPKDVKELREKRILLTTLGSDEEVLKVYKDINTYGVRNVTIFHDVKEKIQAHYNNKAKTWLAELFYTYFNSPWTAIALFAAAFLLVLTFLQTYYTVRPS
ncbi:UPF0481 protein At3g47200-like [Coffea eugenioides]|uniref:UPF0481 protein At3g47200-like n=1 Tax=Coffea eugenioides TaxID=49369 RepID=UPI000F60ACB1|nr:UPF0481 protein At3g47200-like [Coffea eugenioides]